MDIYGKNYIVSNLDNPEKDSKAENSTKYRPTVKEK